MDPKLPQFFCHVRSQLDLLGVFLVGLERGWLTAANASGVLIKCKINIDESREQLAAGDRFTFFAHGTTISVTVTWVKP